MIELVNNQRKVIAADMNFRERKGQKLNEPII